MVKIYFATTNARKFKTLSEVLDTHKIKVVQVPISIAEPRIDDLREIAKQKVLFAFKQIREPCVAQDTGFYVRSLQDKPGARVHDFLEKEGVDVLLREVKGKSRECEFRQCLAYMDANLKKPVFFESVVHGMLAEKPRGKLTEEKKKMVWAKLWLVFIPEGLKKTIAELTEAEDRQRRRKQQRNSFAAKFARWFSKRKTIVAPIKRIVRAPKAPRLIRKIK